MYLERELPSLKQQLCPRSWNQLSGSWNIIMNLELVPSPKKDQSDSILYPAGALWSQKDIYCSMRSGKMSGEGRSRLAGLYLGHHVGIFELPSQCSNLLHKFIYLTEKLTSFSGLTALWAPAAEHPEGTCLVTRQMLLIFKHNAIVHTVV